MKKLCFIEGSLQELELDEKGRPIEAKKETAPEKPKDFDRKAAMAELTAAGVEFRGNASNETLAELLAEAKKETAPPEGGTGDQDVI